MQQLSSSLGTRMLIQFIVSKKDYYDILGVSKDANDQEIKKAYRKMAMKYHPDKHKGDKAAETKFKDINEAYQVLSDKQKRQSYDQFGSADGPGFGGFGGGGFGGQGFNGADFGGFSDIFETFFGGGAGGGGRSARRTGPVRGANIEGNVRLKFEEAVFGTEKELELTKADTCEQCKGDGVEPGSKMVSCNECSGTGEVRSVQNTIFGQMATSRMCGVCEGVGRVPEKKCTTCHGKGRVRKKERVKVKIPAGIDDGSTIRLSGKGEAGVRGGSHGDLYVHIQVQDHKDFERRGYDIYSEVHIHMVQAVLGDEVEVETVNGVKVLKVPAGTQSGKEFKLSGEGVNRLKSSGTGDHIVKIIVDIPDKVSKKEKEHYRALAEAAGLDVKEKKGWFS